uniref:F-box protein 15 n=1 Tax=Takifugu rubripes TaxID=31033 RepID=A0A674N9Z7_TAKRU
TWELTVCDNSGQKTRHNLSWARFCGTSVALCWGGGGHLPDLEQISSFLLHGVHPYLRFSSFHHGKAPISLRPSSRSFMVEVNLSKSLQLISEDRLVELRLLESGTVVGLWKNEQAVAFVMFTLHFHKLVEKSVQGSSLCPYTEPTFKPPFDDIDPEYGLHGYQLHFVLHDTVYKPLTLRFIIPTAQICDGLVQLTAINGVNLGQRTLLSGNLALPWRCGALQGTNGCIMSLTLLDEFHKPFWCVSSPISIVPGQMPVRNDYAGDPFFAWYEDSGGKVEMQLA